MTAETPEKKRKIMFVHATDLANSSLLNGYIRPIDLGMGYVVTDFPDVTKIKNNDDQIKTSWVWWILVELSDLAKAPAKKRNELLPDIHPTYLDMLTGRAENTYQELSLPDYGAEYREIYRKLGGKEKTIYLSMLSFYWELFRATDVELWKE